MNIYKKGITPLFYRELFLSSAVNHVDNYKYYKDAYLIISLCPTRVLLNILSMINIGQIRDVDYPD